MTEYVDPLNISALLPLADGWQTLEKAQSALKSQSGVVLLEGVPLAAKGWILAYLAQKAKQPLLVITYNDEQARRLSADMNRFLPPDLPRAQILPSSLPLLLDDEESGRDVGRAGRRIRTLTDLASGEAMQIVATATALLQKTLPPPAIARRRLTLTVGETLNPDTLAARLNAFGYSREDQVNLPGTFARRGDIFDIFPADAELPIRVDLFGDDIETIRPFDRETQRSEGKIESVTIAAAHETAFTRESMARAGKEMRDQLTKRVAEMERKGEDAERIERLRENAEADILRIEQAVYFSGIERYLPLLHPDFVTALAYLPHNVLVVLDEPSQMASHAEKDVEVVVKNLQGRAERGEILPVDAPCLPFVEGMTQAFTDRPTLMFSLLVRTLDWIAPKIHLHVSGATAESFGGKPAQFAEALDTYRKNNARAVVVSAQVPRVRGVLSERGLPETPLDALLKGKGGIALVPGILESGFRIPDAHLVMMGDNEIFGLNTAKKKRAREFRDGMRLTSLLDLKKGDYVVHILHGIGQYLGMTKMTSTGIEREFLMVQYDGSDRLYVPVDQIDRVQKYIGSEGGAPTLNKLGGSEWQRATARAKKQVKEMAGELIALYAARQAAPGHAYAPDTPWQREMEDDFPYTETPDQLAAIEDVKRDLEAERPMDRLICGDVGFGKTEVAMRAAFKVASEGRQVAVLCPTTVLAAQHFSTFTERMGGFPVKVDMMSRFRSSKEMAKTVEEIKSGSVDIVVGTHRLLSKDVEWKNLGLVIVDEEQRFGVTHKEKLKQLRKSVDVLTMTATPIPRTLHMSMAGIRDMSLINDPPEGRSAVKTLIKEYDDELVREAILRETDRGGQVYFIHNRVESIYHTADHPRRVIPTATFRVAHGQMGEDELEEAMLEFYEHKVDVLVCTTIVESGLDISNVNTILIDAADKMGLAQLYQLRGRVGRSKRQAYAILMYRRGKSLSHIAEQRLDALREFSDLGSGYKVALRDLELRGAGNLLGASQSGTVAAVGFDLYTQLLEQAIREYKGEEPDKAETPLPTVDIPVAASIPENYVPGEPQRILMYKKLAAVRETGDVARLQEEFEDRFGDPPAPVYNALALLRLRLRCQEIGVESITADAQFITIELKRGVAIIPENNLKPLTAMFKAERYQWAQNFVKMPVTGSKVLNQVEEAVETIARALKEKLPPAPMPPPAKRLAPGVKARR